MNKKGIAPLFMIVIVALVALGSGVYFIASKLNGNPPLFNDVPSMTTPLPLSDESQKYQKTYTNTLAGYQISYPSNWVTGISAPGVNFEQEPSPNADSVVLAKKDNSASITIQKFSGKQPYDPETESLLGNLYSATSSQKTTTVDGTVTQAFAVVSKDNSYVELQLNYEPDTESEVYQVLSSFRLNE